VRQVDAENFFDEWYLLQNASAASAFAELLNAFEAGTAVPSAASALLAGLGVDVAKLEREFERDWIAVRYAKGSAAGELSFGLDERRCGFPSAFQNALHKLGVRRAFNCYVNTDPGIRQLAVQGEGETRLRTIYVDEGYGPYDTLFEEGVGALRTAHERGEIEEMSEEEIAERFM
jgi:hypothetical protein